MLRSLRDVPKWAAIRPRTVREVDSSACTIANWSSASFLASVSMITRRRFDGFITLLNTAYHKLLCTINSLLYIQSLGRICQVQAENAR